MYKTGTGGTQQWLCTGPPVQSSTQPCLCAPVPAHTKTSCSSTPVHPAHRVFDKKVVRRCRGQPSLYQPASAGKDKKSATAFFLPDFVYPCDDESRAPPPFPGLNQTWLLTIITRLSDQIHVQDQHQEGSYKKRLSQLWPKAKRN